MSLTATYDPVLGRIRLSATLLGASATRCDFWRTTNNFAQSVTVRGAWPTTVTSQNAHIDDYEFVPGVETTYRVTSFTAANLTPVATFDVVITQDLDVVWLKVPAAPYLNTTVTVVDRSEVVRRSRRGLFDVVGRTLPVMVGDVASGLAFELQLMTETPAAERNLDYVFASGEVVFLHLPSTVEHFPGGYFAVGDVSRETTLRLSPRRVWRVPLTEVAAPGPAVIGPAYTIASMLAEYATISLVIAGNATISDLLQRVGSPSDVIVS
jgi:hypothetical protein